MRVPSIESLCRINGITGKQVLALRQLLKENPSNARIMEDANDILGGYGVEFIQQGKNQKSPAIEYINQGDSYANTLLWVNDNFQVGSWGDIVERGNYD